MADKQPTSKAGTQHPDYILRITEWERVRDCMKGEKAIKDKGETYLPRPAGMSGEYKDAYDPYKERAHFPLIVPYALQGVLGVIIAKLPEFKLPPQLEYLHDNATNDGRTLLQLLIDVIIEIFETGRVPLIVDPTIDNEFQFIQYKAESFINWKTAVHKSAKSLVLAVLKEVSSSTATDDFSHDMKDQYRVLRLKNGTFTVEVLDHNDNVTQNPKAVQFMGKSIDEIPFVVAGSINNNIDIQPIPLISVANCSVQIYRKEADLANSEFLSCNPTLCMVGVNNEDNIPNVVGSSVMIVVPNDQARIFYTETDTAALTHVKDHIKDLYEEAIRHGVAILDNRKGVEAAEALRIRQATQSASVYSIYLSALNAVVTGLKMMCRWGGYDESKVEVDSPKSLIFGVPEHNLVKELIEGFSNSGVIPLEVVHAYLVSAGLLDQKTNFNDYIQLLKENAKLKEELGLSIVPEEKSDEDGEDDDDDDSSKSDDSDDNKSSDKEE